MENRNLLTGIIVAMLVYFAYMFVYTRFIQPRLTPPTPPTTNQPEDAAQPVGSGPATIGAASAPAASTATLQFAAGASRDEITLGGGPDDALRVVLNPLGASVSRLELTAQNAKKTKYIYRESADGNTPHVLLRPIIIDDRLEYSYATDELRIGEGKDRRSLRNLVWSAERVDDHTARFTAPLRSESGEALRIVKEYRLRGDKPLIDLSLRVENSGGEPFNGQLVQDGPVGLPEEGRGTPTRHLLVLYRVPESPNASASIELKKHLRTELQKAGQIEYSSSTPQAYFAWTALVNKYFGVFTRPLSSDVAAVRGSLLTQTTDPQHDQGDYRAQLTMKSVSLQPHTQIEYKFEIYAGPKDTDILSKVDAGFANRLGVGYVIAQDADLSCCCSFGWLTSLMKTMLDAIHFIVRNYGIAIIVMVLIVRTLLHPLARFQQRAMYKFQETFAKLQPKLDEVKAKFPNDAVKQQQEQMKVWTEAGVNPMAPMISMLPMMLQMPILIALWTAMNTDVHLRHSPLDGWWIRDLASPDSLIHFASPITIPVLGWLPFIGTIFTDIPGFNLLPIVMGVSMYLQTKYMPKPQMAERKAAAEKAGGAALNSFEEQMKQQQVMSVMMSFMFPLMFYYMPAGLNLYWLATNVFGIGESLIIRKQLEEEKVRRATLGDRPEPPKPPGFFGKLMKALAERAEEIQKQADQISRDDKQKGKRQK